MQVANLHVKPGPPPRVRLFPSSDLHVTLGFLGSVQESEAQKAWALVGEFSSFRQVSGTFTGVEAMGHPRKPSALAAVIDQGRGALRDMIVEARGPVLHAAGAPEDSRSPLPHMTLARIQRRASADERREAIRWARSIDLGAVTYTVPSVALYTWTEDRRERLFRIVEERGFGGTP